MLTSRADQENAVHARQLTAATKAGNNTKSLAPKTPSFQRAKTPFRGGRGDENAISLKKGDGKVKDAVAVLEGKAAKMSLSTPAATRAPLGLKTGNIKANAFQTPARALTQHKPVNKASSPRIRKAKFQVHDAQSNEVKVVPEEREIEYMHPRGTPLPDFPDDDLWPHDRKYPQFEGDNFSRGWAAEFMKMDDDVDFAAEMERREAQDKQVAAKKAPGTTVFAKPGTVTSIKAVSALSNVRGTANFASATSSSAARSRPTAKPASRNERHVVAKSTSNTTLGYSKGRRVSATRHALNESTNDLSPLTPAERTSVLQAMWQHADDNDAELDFEPPTLDILDLHDLKEFGDDMPDD